MSGYPGTTACLAHVAGTLLLGLSLSLDACTSAPAHGVAVPLEEKLTRQFARYDTAREALTHRALTGARYSRREWERLLDPGPEYRLTDADLETLRRDQRRRIEASARRARERSAIDLNSVRARGLIREFARAMPKGALLHLHPNGALRRATVEKLLAAVNPQLHPADLKDDLSRPDHALRPGELDFLDGYPDDVRFADLRPDDKSRFIALFFLPEGTHDFPRFEAVFRLMGLLRSNPGVNFWGTVYDDVARSAQSLGIRHVEFTKGFELNSGEMAALPDIAERAWRDHGVSFRWNFAFNREASRKEKLRLLDDLLAMPPMDVITGIDLLGREDGYPTLDTGQQIYGRLLAARKSGKTALLRTLHAAGIGEIRNIRDALIFGVERVSHASRIERDPVALEYAARRAQAVEANLVSNVRLGYARDYATHPFLDMLRLGLRVSLSTDDEGILVTDLVNEYAVAIAHTDVSYDELKRMTINSVETSFLDPATRGRLAEELREDLGVFEREWTRTSGDAGLAASRAGARSGSE